MKTFGHVLYFSEDLLLPPPYTYFSIDFKDISSTIVAKVGGGQVCPQAPHGHATDDSLSTIHQECHCSFL